MSGTRNNGLLVPVISPKFEAEGAALSYELRTAGTRARPRSTHNLITGPALSETYRWVTDADGGLCNPGPSGQA